MKQTKFILPLVGIQLIIIAGLSFNLYQSKATYSVSPILKEQISFDPHVEFVYFHEPAANIPVVLQPPWLPYKPVITINTDTLNERFEYSVEKPHNTFRIITLGDSWTYGQYVSTEDNFSEQLERLLNETRLCEGVEKFEVLNLGVGSYDIAYSTERFEKRGQKYDPDLVLWLLIDNDFKENAEYIKTQSEFHKNALESSAESITPKERAEAGNLFTDSLTQRAAITWIRALKDQANTFTPEDIVAYQKRFLTEFSQYYSNPLVLFTLKNSVLEHNAQKAVQEFALSREDSYVYESNLMLDGEELLYDGHPSASGHARIAHDLNTFLTENRLIPCS